MQLINNEFNKLKIDQKIKDILFIENTEEKSIQWGMNYILFSPSKRIRPLLVLESNLVFSNIDEDSYILACAIELIHTYSLVHDDLPCMDDDELRRGVKTLHTIKNEAYALLVGDALLTRGFGILSRYTKKDKINEILVLFAGKSGYQGMIYGQFLDLEAEGKNLDIEKINNINKNKTGALLELALLIGAINGNASEEQKKTIEELGSIIGYIFQLKDDILDIIGDEKKMGKKAGSDKKNQKSSIPLITGIDRANELLKNYKEKAMECIKKIPSNKDFFNNFIEYIIKREK